ncbi:hypothetical protein C8F04DRAFT_1210102 [Mycena alexandri]|uniref:Uncharacterized protein n=1 Tax=Mycena alexandri TaxID=1745969 RepID=A0AAD6SYC0_9AGAR|nr:hypothetical protein C8F04DRAFT_1210102 [Mycena alexandri]
MGNRSISRNVKIAALNLYERGHLPLKEILAWVGFSRSTFFRVLHLWRTTGDVERKSNRTGRPRLLHHDDITYLLLLVQERPDCSSNNRFISIHYTTIHRELERAGMSTKKLSEIAAERCEPSRLDHVRQISQYPAHFLGFLDETSKNDKTPGRRLGRAKKGKRAGISTSIVVEGVWQYLGFLEHQVVISLSLSFFWSLFANIYAPASALLTLPRAAQCPGYGQG